MIYPDKERDTIKLSNDAMALAIVIKTAYNKRHSERGACKGWVNGVAMPHSAEMGETQMVDNISAFNTRLAKAKRRVQSNAKKWGLTLTKDEVQKQAIIDLRLRDPKWMRKARDKIKDMIRAQGMKLSHVKSTDIDEAAKELIRQQ